jgi:hypothetical protein
MKPGTQLTQDNISELKGKTFMVASFAPGDDPLERIVYADGRAELLLYSGEWTCSYLNRRAWELKKLDLLEPGQKSYLVEIFE